MSVTLRQIAQKANVSEMTVSNVLNGRSALRQPRAIERARQIRALADKLGYRPNAAAKATRAGRFGMVSLLLSIEPNRSSLFGGMLHGIEQTLSVAGLQLLLHRLPDSTLTDESELPHFLRESCSDGVIINYTDHIPQRMIDVLDRHNVPAIWMNSRHEHDCVYPDDFDAGYRATAHLLGLGHRRIAFSDYSHGWGYDQPHYSAIERLAGYEKAMREAGFEPVIVRGEGFNVHGSQRAKVSRDHLTRPDRPTAVVCYGNNDTIPWFLAATSIGLDVPQHLSLVEFGGQQIDVLGPRMATMLLPEQQIGQAAAEMLIEKLNHPEHPLPCRPIPATFNAGGSTARPSADQS